MIHIFNSVVPVFVLIILGAVLKNYGWTDEGFHRTSDRLVYFIFFPTMLFWKIGGGGGQAEFSWDACVAVLCALSVVYLLGIAYALASRMPRSRVGSFSQCCYRFNTYVGMAVIIASIGERGIAQFAVIISVVIPLVNVVAVSTLIWFSGESTAMGERWRLIARSTLSNPLIIGCLLGLGYAKLKWPMPGFAANTFRLMAWVSLPLALLSIGGSLTFQKVRTHLGTSLVATFLKLVVLPAAGYLFLNLFRVPPLATKVAMIYLALPTSTAIYILSAQLHSDVDLASAAIVISTVGSFVSLSLVFTLM